MKLTAVSLVSCGALAADIPVLKIILETPTVNDDIPEPCPQVAGEFKLTVFEQCHTSLEGYTGAFTYSGQLSADPWSGNPCVGETSEPVATYFSMDSLVKYVPVWMQTGAGTGAYTVELQTATSECDLTFLKPSDPAALCTAGVIDGSEVGSGLHLAAGTTSFEVQAADFEESVKIAVVSTCAPLDAGVLVKSITATTARYPFLFSQEAPAPTTNPGGDSTGPGSPEGVSAHLVIGTLFVLPLVATW